MRHIGSTLHVTYLFRNYCYEDSMRRLVLLLTACLFITSCTIYLELGRGEETGCIGTHSHDEDGDIHSCSITHEESTE